MAEETATPIEETPPAATDPATPPEPPKPGPAPGSKEFDAEAKTGKPIHAPDPTKAGPQPLPNPAAAEESSANDKSEK